MFFLSKFFIHTPKSYFFLIHIYVMSSLYMFEQHLYTHAYTHISKTLIEFISRTTTDDVVDTELATKPRQGRQQNGDTYILEIAFPAVKYVTLSVLRFAKSFHTRFF
jgi:hypothetical protein